MTKRHLAPTHSSRVGIIDEVIINYITIVPTCNGTWASVSIMINACKYSTRRAQFNGIATGAHALSVLRLCASPCFHICKLLKFYKFNMMFCTA